VPTGQERRALERRMNVGASRSRVIQLIAVFAPVAMLSQSYRTSHAVIAPDLMRELALSPEELGTLTGVYFLIAALAQLPSGILFDRFGPQRTVPLLLLVAMSGALVFSSASSFTALVVGRALMGAGCATLIMGAFVLCTRWAPPSQFGSLVGILIGLSQGGMILATTPMAWVTRELGWRSAFVMMGGAAALLALVVWLAIRERPPEIQAVPTRPEDVSAVFKGVGAVLTNPRLPRIFVMAFFGFATQIAVLGLWGGPYLHDLHGLGAVARGNVLLAMAIGLAIGNFGFGALERRLGIRKWLVIPGGWITVVILTMLGLLPTAPLWVITVLFALLGLSGAYTILIVAHGRTLFADHLVGRGITTINMGVMVGTAVVQGATGLIIGAFPAVNGAAPAIAYRLMFLFLAAVLGSALFIYRGAADPRMAPQGKKPLPAGVADASP
jgi:predicted MFS family arabinose efflux permease